MTDKILARLQKTLSIDNKKKSSRRDSNKTRLTIKEASPFLGISSNIKLNN